MSDLWTPCVGQIVDGRFRLEQYLAGTPTGAIFLTNRGEGPGEKAAIRFVDALRAEDSLLAQWRKAEQLSHPHLQKLFQSGRCRLASREFLYLAEEFAEENLAQVLPERALSQQEVRELLGPLAEVISYLHSKGLVHTRLKPENIMANGNRLLLSSDKLQPAGTLPAAGRTRDRYDAPETAGGAFLPAADLWSLGWVLVEALTQHSPRVAGAEVQLPEGLPEPFQTLARKLLQADPQKRGTIAEIVALLSPGAAEAVRQVVSPAALPVSHEPALPVAKLQPPRPLAPERKFPNQIAGSGRAVRRNGAREFSRFAVPLSVLALILLGVIFVPKLLNQTRKTRSPQTAGSSQAPTRENVPGEPPNREAGQAAPLAQAQPPEAHSAQEPASDQKDRPDPAGETAPVGGQARESSAGGPASTSNQTNREAAPGLQTPAPVKASSARGEVLEQFLPELSPKAQATIHGTFFISLRVQVDAAGAVTDGQFDSPGPSPTFAELAMKAARKWSFGPPEVGGRPTPSEWLIRFQFSESGVQAISRQQ